VQVEPKSPGAVGDAFNDTGGEGHEKCSGEDGGGWGERGRLVHAARSDDGANQQEKADKGKDFVDKGERRLEGLARRAMSRPATKVAPKSQAMGRTLSTTKGGSPFLRR